MIIYLAGGVSGNLKPAWKNMARGGQITSTAFIEALRNESFLGGGESRHWIQDELLKISKKKDMRLYLAGVTPWRSGGGMTR